MRDGHDPGSISGEDFIAVGRFVRTVGLKGSLYAMSFGGTLGKLKPPCRIFVGAEGSPPAQMRLSTIRGHAKGFCCSIDGCDSIEKAVILRGALLFLPQSDLPQLAKGEYFHFELEGMQVVAQPGDELIGVVAGVHNYPTLDALSVQRPSGEELLVPLNPEVVLAINREERQILVTMAAIDELL